MDTLQYLAERKLKKRTVTADQLQNDTRFEGHTTDEITEHPEYVTSSTVVDRIETLSRRRQQNQLSSGLNYSRFGDKAKNQVITDVRDYARERNQGLNRKDLSDRRKGLDRKADLTRSLNEDAMDYGHHTADRKRHLAESLNSDRTQIKIKDDYNLSYTDNEGHTPDLPDLLEAEDRIMDQADRFTLDTDSYGDDALFTRNFRDNQDSIMQLTVFYNFLTQQASLENKGAIGRFAAARYWSPDLYAADLKERYDRMLAERAYFAAKMYIIRSPYYPLLKKEDLGRLTESELETKALFFESQEKPLLASYIRAVKNLKASRVTHEKGVTVNNSTVNVLGREMSKTDTTIEHSTHAFKVNIDMASTARKEGSAGYKHPFRDDFAKEASDSTKKKSSARKFGEQMSDSLEAGVSFNYAYTGKKRTIKVSSDHADMEYGYSRNNAAVSGSVAASLFKDGKINPQFRLGLNANYSALDLHAAAGIHTKEKLMGLNVLEFKSKAAASLLTTKAKFKLGVGRYKGTDRSGALINIKGDAGAYLAKGSASATLSVIGMDATVKAEGAVGFGAKFKYNHVPGKVKIAIGIVFGVGGNVTFTVDYGRLATAIKDKIMNAYRAKHDFRGEHVTP